MGYHESSTGVFTVPMQITQVSFVGQPPFARAAAVASRETQARRLEAAMAASHAHLCRFQSACWHALAQ